MGNHGKPTLESQKSDESQTPVHTHLPTWRLERPGANFHTCDIIFKMLMAASRLFFSSFGSGSPSALGRQRSRGGTRQNQ